MLTYAGLGLAQAQTPNKLPLASAGLSLEKVGLGVYALVSSTDFPPADAAKIAICNGGIILSDEGTILIDPFQNKALGKLMLETAKSLSQEPIRYVINSHFHFDHSLETAEYARPEIVNGMDSSTLQCKKNEAKN